MMEKLSKLPAEYEADLYVALIKRNATHSPLGFEKLWLAKA